jgi:hypothetical protein
MTYADASICGAQRKAEEDQTRPVVIFRLWMLTGSDLTLGFHGEQRVHSVGEAARACVSRRGTGTSDPVSGTSGHLLTAKSVEF